MSRPRRLAVAAPVAFALIAFTACGGQAAGAPATTGVPPQYQAALAQRLGEGRAVTDDLVAGRVASVYARSTPEVRAQITLAEAERLFGELGSQSPIGVRVAERAAPLSPDRGIYWADHRWGEGRLRFTVIFTAAGLIPSIEPVTALPVDPRADERAKAKLRLPFDGQWWASEAPTPEIGAHHLVAPNQRHAYDFTVWRESGTYWGTGTDNADYWCWGQPVLAPADAGVVSVRDGLSDNRPWVETNPAEPAGNHVILDLGHTEYAVLAHFQRGSIRVAEGGRVHAGDILGLCGNSGNSSEPHVHFHVQDKPTFFADGAVGIPVRFGRFLADGVPSHKATPTSGQFLTADVSANAGRP